MHLNHTPESKVMPFEFIKSFCCSISSVSIYHGPQWYTRVKSYAVWICWELLCSISSVSIYYAPKSDIQVKCYDHWNFSSTSIVQFQATRWVMSPNWTSVWKVMTTRISQELSLFNFEHLDILCPRIEHPSEMLWPFEFVESFHCSISSVWIYYVPESDIRVKCYDHSKFSRASIVQFRASRWVMPTNRTSKWNVMTIQSSREFLLFRFECLDVLSPRIGDLCEK